MAFQLTRLNVPSLTTDYSAETNAAGGLAQTIGNLIPNMQKQRLAAQKEQLLGQLGTGEMDFDKAGRALLSLGDTQAGATLLTLGQKAKEQQREADWLNKNADLFGGAATGGGKAAPAPMATLGNPSVAASPRGVAVAETPQDVARLEAQSSGGTQFGNRNEPRGLRNNNPGNIESGRFAATVQGFEGSDGRFARYATPEQGIQAADKLLQTYAGRGLNTVAGIVNRWAPPTENNTGAYVASVARELGVDPNQPLDMGNWETRQKLIAAKIRVENGKQPYSEDVFQRALNPNWGSEVASFEGRGAAPERFIANAPPAADRFTPPPSQVARAPEAAPAQDGLYTNTPTPQLQAFINNPRVPDNLRTIMRQELARRGDGGAPVQLAQAPAQPGAPLSDADELNRPVAGAEAQFVIPGTTPEQTQSIMADKKLQRFLRAYDTAPANMKASVKQRIDLRIEELKFQRGEEARQADLELKKIQVESERRKLAGDVPPPGFRFKAGTRDLEPIPGGPADDKTGREIAARAKVADERGLQGEARDAFIYNARVPVGAEKTTEGQANAALYADRMKEAEAVFAKPGMTEAGMSRVQQGLSKIPSVGNSLVSPEFQQVDQAQRNFINATLRRESGAVISEQEFDNARKQYFPQPGDKPEVLAQKARNRQTAIQGIGNAAGPNYAKRQGTPEAQPAPQTQARPAQPQGVPQGARQAPDGNFYVSDPSRPGKYLMVQP